MKDHLDPAQGPAQGIVVQNVAFDNFNLGGDVGKVLSLSRKEVIENTNPISPFY